MSHLAYSPVGYDYRADSYCLDCIPNVARVKNHTAYDAERNISYTQRNGGNGYKRGECNCCECRLDRTAAARGIDRMDEGSYDSSVFPKSIPYHNDGHAECGPEAYGEDDDDWSADRQYCNLRCSKCGDVIDGTSQLDGPDICPVYANHKSEVSA